MPGMAHPRKGKRFVGSAPGICRSAEKVSRSTLPCAVNLHPDDQFPSHCWAPAIGAATLGVIGQSSMGPLWRQKNRNALVIRQGAAGLPRRDANASSDPLLDVGVRRHCFAGRCWREHQYVLPDASFGAK